MTICVFGASSDSLQKEYYDAAFALGEALARGGHALVYGGGRGGLMGACARGVLSLGGEITGVAPRFFDEGDVLLKEHGRFLFTDTMAERKTMMEDLADGFIVLPGGVGTLEEFFETLTLCLLGRHQKPMALLNTCGYFDLLRKLLEDSIEKGFTSPACREILSFCTEPAEALEALGRAPAVSGLSLADYTGK